MIVLIVEPNPDLGRLWKRHMERQGAEVHLVQGQDAAFDRLRAHAVDMIVLDLVLEDGSALAISDYASYRRPDAQVIFVTNTTFFSDGSIFLHSPTPALFCKAPPRPRIWRSWSCITAASADPALSRDRVGRRNPGSG